MVGNRGRLLDARRTPVTVTGIAPHTAMFEVEIGAFEDVGARWRLPFEDVAGFQFARDSALASDDVVAERRRAADRFDRPGHVEVAPNVREDTLRRLAGERRAVGGWLAAHDAILRGVDVRASIATREGVPGLFALLERFLASRGLAELDRRFTETFVSNPRSGELVKGHAIVLAELGLCAYRGQVVRDPRLFDGAWSKARRAEHLLARLAFTQALWSRLDHAQLTLYRAAAADGQLAPRPRSFVSATFSKEVADDHFQGGPTTRVAVLWRQVVPLDRVLMTFLETAAMSRTFKEAEAVLLADPGNRAF
ncbi:MAG TPA: hypothetical protein VNS09_13780 [Solirubrobacter sp.]|nr:hypothetical protein [Solirubrobacter sp.]